MSFAIVMLSFGSCVAYFIIVGDNFGGVFKEHVIERFQLPETLASRQVPILATAVGVVLPVSLQRSMVALAPASTIAVLVMTLTTGNNRTLVSMILKDMLHVAAHLRLQIDAGPCMARVCSPLGRASLVDGDFWGCLARRSCTFFVPVNLLFNVGVIRDCNVR